MQENQFYTLHVAGLTRELPICKVDDTLSIAAFVMFSDVEMTVECAKALLQKVPEFDLILTAVSRWRTKWQSKAGKTTFWPGRCPSYI